MKYKRHEEQFLMRLVLHLVEKEFGLSPQQLVNILFHPRLHHFKPSLPFHLRRL